jgi:hypothetical protein
VAPLAVYVGLTSLKPQASSQPQAFTDGLEAGGLRLHCNAIAVAPLSDVWYFRIALNNDSAIFCR